MQARWSLAVPLAIILTLSLILALTMTPGVSCTCTLATPVYGYDDYEGFVTPHNALQAKREAEEKAEQERLEKQRLADEEAERQRKEMEVG